MRITRQSDYYGLDYRYADTVPTEPAQKPPAGLEDMLKYKSVTPGTMLHQVNQAISGTPSQDTGPERWPAVLPGDQIVNALGGTENQVKNLLPKVVKVKPKAVPKVKPTVVPKSKVLPVSE